MSEVRIVAEIEVRPDDLEGLRPAFKALVEGSRAEAGNRAYDLTQDLENPCRFFVIETWASAEAVAEHNASPHFLAFGKAVEGKTAKRNVTRLKNLF